MSSWYGNFDIVFPGASINCNNPKKVEALKDYISGKSDSYLVDLSLSSNDQEKTELLWYNTTYIHESRHVHDYLLSPVLNKEYRLRLLSIINTLGALSKSGKEDTPYNVFPIPVQDWFHLELEEKRELLKSWSNSSFEARAPLYTVSRDYLLCAAFSDSSFENYDLYTKLLVSGAAYFEEYNKRLKRKVGDQYGRVFTLRSLLEASAVITQLTSAFLLYGDDCYAMMTKTLADASKQETLPTRRFTDYTFVLSYIRQYIKYQGLIDTGYLLPFAAIVINWSLFCNTLLPNQRLDPVMRFREFIECDYAKGMTLESIIADIESAFAYWDKKYGDGIFDISEYNLMNRSGYQEIQNTAENCGLYKLANFVEMLAQASQKDTLVYMDNPLNYILPELYIKNFHTLSNVPLRFYFEEGTIQLSNLDAHNAEVKCDDIIQKQVEKGIDPKVTAISLDQPDVKLYANSPAQKSKHIELRTEISNSITPYFDLIKAIYEPSESSMSSETLKEIIAPLKLQYLLV